jgi:hypothetical protein
MIQIMNRGPALGLRNFSPSLCAGRKLELARRVSCVPAERPGDEKTYRNPLDSCLLLSPQERNP